MVMSQTSAFCQLDNNICHVQVVEEQFGTLLRDYNQVRDDVAQGLGFYGQLQEVVKALHQEVGDYCLARSAFAIHYLYYNVI